MKKFKDIYLNSGPSQSEILSSWDAVASLLPAQDMPTPKHNFKHQYYFAGFALLLIVSLIGITSAAQGAKPGEQLYPVKMMSDTVLHTLLGKPQIKTDTQLNKIQVSITPSSHTETNTDEHAASNAAHIENQKNSVEKAKSTEVPMSNYLQTRNGQNNNTHSQSQVNNDQNESDSGQQAVKGASTTAQSEHPNQSDHANNASDNSNNQSSNHSQADNPHSQNGK